MVMIRGTIKKDIHERVFQVGKIRVVSQLGARTHIKDIEATIDVLVDIATKLNSIKGITHLVDPIELNGMYVVVDKHQIPITHKLSRIEIDYKRL